MSGTKVSEQGKVSILQGVDILADAIENGKIEPREGLRLLAILKKEDRGLTDDETVDYIADELEDILNNWLGMDVEVVPEDEEYLLEDLRNEIDYTIRNLVERLKEKGMLPADFKTEVTPEELAKRIIERIMNNEGKRVTGSLGCFYNELPALSMLANFIDDEEFIRSLEQEARRAHSLEIYEDLVPPDNIEETKRKVREMLQALNDWFKENGFINYMWFRGNTFADKYGKVFVGLSELLPFVQWLKDEFRRVLREGITSRETLSQVLPEIVSTIKEIVDDETTADDITYLLRSIGVINGAQYVIEDMPLEEFKDRIRKDLADFERAIRENGFVLQEA